RRRPDMADHLSSRDCSPMIAAIPPDTTRVLLVRLLREYILHYKARLVWVLVLSGAMAGATALYPLVLRYAGILLTAGDPRLAWQIPLAVVGVTTLQGITPYLPTIQDQHFL